MKAAVRYYSRSGNTKRLADAIAEAAGCAAREIPMSFNERMDVLFLGAAVYWGGISPEVKTFIRGLDKSKVGKVAVFSTSALAQRAFPQIQKELIKAGVAVEAEDFYCRGQFKTLHRGKPDENDLAAAREFARRIIGR